MRIFSVLSCAVGASVFFAGVASQAAADAPGFRLAGTYELPVDASAFDVRPDGRLVVLRGTDVLVQDALNASTYTLVGSVPVSTVSNFGASFLAVSPDGSTIAYGDNDFGAGAEVSYFDAAALSTASPVSVTTIAAQNFDGFWRDNSTLYVTGGSGVTEIDTVSGASRSVIDGIGGAPAGVVTDGANLFVGNGFRFSGPSETGDVKAFSLSSIDAAITPINFESSGVTIVDDLSAASLGFDAAGNLLVGGGDAFGGSGDVGYFAVYDAAALPSALAGLGEIDRTTQRFKATPAGAFDSYFPVFNAFTGEILVSSFGNSTLFRYEVPAPGTVAMLAFACVAASRRRRSSH